MVDTDYKSSLPIRSESDGTDEKVVVKVIDGTNGGVNQMSVDSDKAAKILATGHDPGAVNRTLRTSELGAITPDGLYNASNNTKPGNTGLIASSRTATPSDSTQTQRLTSITDTDSGGIRHALDVSMLDQNGNAWTPSNPVPVAIVGEPAGQTDVFASMDALAIAAGSSSNLDYTVTASKTLELRKVLCSASVRMRFELQKSTDGITFTRVMVLYNNTSEFNVTFDFTPLDLDLTGTGSKIRIVALNQDHSSSDAHALFIGTEK